MTRLTSHDFEPEVLKLFDQYVHGLLSRRGFLQSASKYAAAGVSAEVLLVQLSPNFANAQQVPESDPRIQTEFVEIDSPQGYGKVRAYLAKPSKANGKLPTVLVVHENRGLNPHIQDIARRLALDGFAALAPDGLFPLAGYPGDEDKARALFQQLDQAKSKADFVAALRWLKAYKAGNGKAGVVGFCYGGGMANYLATQVPELDAAVAFYGAQPQAEDVAKIHSPLLLHYAANDERINAGWPKYEQALQQSKVRYEAYTYDGTQHGFNNDTTPRFDQSAATLAWHRTLAFFNTNLKKS